MKSIISQETLTHAVQNTIHPLPAAGASLKPASVIALFIFKERPALLFIQKADVKGYPWRGQMAFPGGHQDRADPSLRATAIRELKEEMNLFEKDVEIIGSIGHFSTINNTEINAFVGVWHQQGEIDFDPAEISRIVTIPFHHLLKTHILNGFNRRQPDLTELAYHYEDVVVWGVTAKIVHHLIESLLSAVNAASYA